MDTAFSQRSRTVVEAFIHGQRSVLATASESADALGQAARFLAAYVDGRSGSGWEACDGLMDVVLAIPDLPIEVQVCVLSACATRWSTLGRHGAAGALVQRLEAMAPAIDEPRTRAMIHRQRYWSALQRQDTAAAIAIATEAQASLPEGSDAWVEFAHRACLVVIDDHDLHRAALLLETLRRHPDALRRCGVQIALVEDNWDLVAGRPERILERHRRGEAPPPEPWHLGAALLNTGRFAELGRCIASLPADLRGPDISSLAGQLTCWMAVRRGRHAEVERRLAGIAMDPASTQQRWALTLAMSMALDRRRIRAARTALEQLDPERNRGQFLFDWARLLRLEGDLAGAQEACARFAARGPHSMIVQRATWARELDAAGMAQLLAGGEASAPRPPAPVPAPAPGAPDHVLIGDSPLMIAVRAQIVQAATLPMPVLIVGETGTGKEIAARLLHRQGPGDAAPFVALNCGALGDSLAEAELFGHAKGAFTGAVDAAPGLVAAATGGTLFLDEINSLSLRLQGLLLRLLETGDYRPVGGTQARQAACRIVLASNQDLVAAVAAGTFRSDLRFRMERLVLHMPALREHPEDIPALAEHILRRCTRDPNARLDDTVREALVARPWPGNVRELRNEIERLVLFGGPAAARRSDRPPRGATPAATARPAATEPRSRSTAARIPGPPAARERRQRILALFDRLAEVFPADAITETGAAGTTIARDLEALEAAGLIRRDRRSGHARMNPYLLISQP